MEHSHEMNQEYQYPEFDKSFLEKLEPALEKFAERECLKFHDQIYTYREVDQLSAKVANQLIAAGFEKGMHGAIYSLNSAIAFIVALGIIRAGGVWVPVNARNSESTNRTLLNNLGCDALFFQRAFAAVAQQASDDGLCQICSIVLDGESSNGAATIWDWMAGAPETKPVVDIVGKDLLTLPQTGGTTGLPKGVMVSHRNISCVSYKLCAEVFKPDGTLMCTAPMTHAGGRYVLTTLPLGLRYVILEKVDPQIILKTIQEDKVTDFFLPPTALYTLLDQPNFDDFDLSSLRGLTYGSAPINSERLKEAIERIGPVLNSGFSQTECPLSITFFPSEDHFIDGQLAGERLRSVGRPTIGTTVAILDEEQNELPVGEHGEIAVKSGSVSEGYYQAPEQTAQIRKKGWHLTGDLGYVDEEGYVYIAGRKKDMIITGGFNVYPAEVEESIMNIPGVKLAAVVGLPDEKWGEAVTAFVEADSDDLAAESIIAQCKEKLGSVKTPKTVNFIAEIPRTTLGKIDKKALVN